MADCFLSAFGECSSRISREHYLSASVMKVIAPQGDLRVGGLAWQPPDTMQGIGIGSLQAKVLCSFHNSALSVLDTEAANFVGALVAVSNASESLAHTTEFSGAKIERWLLKVLCGISASGGLKTGSVQSRCMGILVGGDWPSGWGLYAGPSSKLEVFTRDLFIGTSINSVTGELSAAFFRIAGVGISLVLHTPDHPERFGVHRPRGFVFQARGSTFRVGLQWPDELSAKAILFTHLGETDIKAPHTLGWKEQGAKGGA